MLRIFGKSAISLLNKPNCRTLKYFQDENFPIDRIPSKDDKFLKLLHNFGQQGDKEYYSVQSEVIDFLCDTKRFKAIQPFGETYRQIFEYNHYLMPENSVSLVSKTFKILADKDDLTEENLKLAYVLCWCYKFYAASASVTDDVIDDSDYHIGQITWYKMHGFKAINHAFVLQYSAYFLLKEYFRKSPIYVPLMEIFPTHMIYCYLAQGYDNIKFEKSDKSNLVTLKFENIAYMKGGMGAIIMPILLGAVLAGKLDERLHQQLQLFTQQLEPFFQATNDVLECYGKPLGEIKVGKDISQGKCTWLLIKALEVGTPAQKEIIYKYYGEPGKEAEIAILNLYEELEMLKLFWKFEESTVDKLVEMIAQFCSDID